MEKMDTPLLAHPTIVQPAAPVVQPSKQPQRRPQQAKQPQPQKQPQLQQQLSRPKKDARQKVAAIEAEIAKLKATQQQQKQQQP
jgi:hypothetical protein